MCHLDLSSRINTKTICYSNEKLFFGLSYNSFSFPSLCPIFFPSISPHLPFSSVIPSNIHPVLLHTSFTLLSPPLQIVSSLLNCFLFLSRFFHLSIHLKSWAPSYGTSCHLSFWPPVFPSIHPSNDPSSCFTLLSTFHPTYFLCSCLPSATVKNPYGLFPYCFFNAKLLMFCEANYSTIKKYAWVQMSLCCSRWATIPERFSS